MQTQLDYGRRLRDAALALFNERRSTWINMVRSFAINHAKKAGTVSINDCRTCFELPAGYHKSTWGAVLRCEELEAVGYTQAEHKDAHARVIRVYAVKNANT